MDSDAPLSDRDPFQERSSRRSRRRRRNERRPALGVFLLVVVSVGVVGAMVALVPYRSLSLNDARLKTGRSPVGSVGVLTLHLGTGLEGERLSASGREFGSGTTEIDMVADLTGVEGPINVSGRLFSLRAERPVDTVPMAVSKPGIVTFAFPKGKAPWPTGRWRASVLVEGREAAFTEFDVR